MKRYWLFSWDTYYPSGGMSDYRGSFDSLEDARRHLNLSEKISRFDHYEILDRDTMEIVESA
jgi:hypothetical protein